MENKHLTDEQLQSYFDGTCEMTEQIIVGNHLQHCKDCKNEFEQLKSLHKIIQAEFSVQPLSFNIADKVADKIYNKEKAASPTLDSFLLILLIGVSLSGLVYYLIFILQNTTIWLLLTVAASYGMYFLPSYGEVRALQNKLKHLK